MADDFPIELVKEMLSKLPVMPLLRFKCVSKSWKSLIESPDFIRMHLSHSVKTTSNQSLVLRNGYLHLHSADYDSFHNTNSAVFHELDYPLKNSNFNFPSKFLGSCNGLLCMLNVDEVIVLWNPSTKKIKKLPVIEIELPRIGGYYALHGFGYDCVNDDYKVVRIVQFYCVGDNGFDSEVKVYSLKSNSWRKIQDFPHFVRYQEAILANGALHWVVSGKSEDEADFGKRVAAFDLGTEHYRPVPLPEFSDERFRLNLGVLGGCLCVVCNYEMDEHADIWVMKEYGVKESWTNLISIKQGDLYTTNGFGFELLRPIAYSNCGKRVLLEQDNKFLTWYDLEEKSIAYTALKSSSGYDIQEFELDIFVHSLVLLNAEDSGKEGKQERKPDRKQEKKV